MASRLRLHELHPAVPGLIIREGSDWCIVVAPRLSGQMVCLVVDDLLAQLERWEADERSIRDAEVIRDTVYALAAVS